MNSFSWKPSLKIISFAAATGSILMAGGEKKNKQNDIHGIIQGAHDSASKVHSFNYIWVLFVA